MRRRVAERRHRRLIELARWFETFWWCRCSYSNIAALRCHYCGARPPRRLRAEVRDRHPARRAARARHPARRTDRARPDGLREVFSGQ